MSARHGTLESVAVLVPGSSMSRNVVTCNVERNGAALDPANSVSVSGSTA